MTDVTKSFETLIAKYRREKGETGKEILRSKKKSEFRKAARQITMTGKVSFGKDLYKSALLFIFNFENNEIFMRLLKFWH